MVFTSPYRNKFAAVFAACCLCVAITPVRAQLYKCIDAKGKVTYQESACSADRSESRIKTQDQGTGSSLSSVKPRAPEPKAEEAKTDSSRPPAEVDKAEAALKARVLGVLKDPDSAQFRNVQVGSYGQVMCGEVNAKNALGGYVGFRPFRVDIDGVHVATDKTRNDWVYTKPCR